ncbi:hypothetical protein GIB67_031829 [Kingdonia uniflora]|uniref:Uncharacterized protein n=1 Tax=Kingdonia uniflora TaxID=39325 RepID=A0A7J7L4L0_9MAGN|nr:hypothetical protein GIB67_031829 [Kingdonia uniflora]
MVHDSELVFLPAIVLISLRTSLGVLCVLEAWSLSTVIVIGGCLEYWIPCGSVVSPRLLVVDGLDSATESQEGICVSFGYHALRQVVILSCVGCVNSSCISVSRIMLTSIDNIFSPYLTAIGYINNSASDGPDRLHAHLDELLPRVLLESFIQRLISQDEKNQVDQVWPLRKDELSPEAKKSNRSTYMMIGEEAVCLNALYILFLNQWLDNEVINVYIKALIQYFDTQHRARQENERIVLADIFACQYISRAFNLWTCNISSPEGV